MKFCESVRFDILQPLPESVTFCATVNESGDEQVVTDMMIRRACEQADDMQIWPYSARACARTSSASSSNERCLEKTAVIIPFPSKGSRS